MIISTNTTVFFMCRNQQCLSYLTGMCPSPKFPRVTIACGNFHGSKWEHDGPKKDIRTQPDN